MRKPFRVTEAMRSRDRRTAALGYAKAGFSVLALNGITDKKCDCGNAECKSPGKHPIGSEFPHGHHDATCDLGRIDQVFSKYPNANFGIVPDDGLIVVDVDGPLGEKSIASIALPETPIVRTGRGRHLFLRAAKQGKRLKKLPGVDYRLDGKGYVVAAPSKHASGVSYRMSDETDSIALLPDDFYSSKTVSVDFSQVDTKIAKGGRNSFLASMAGTLRVRGLSRRAVAGALLAINRETCQPPLKDSEVTRIAKSVGRYGTDAVHGEDLFGPPFGRTPLPMEYLWYPYIPRYGVTILAGDPGKGKSLLTSLLIATVTNGLAWPLSSERPTGNKVLLLSAEDNWDRVTLPRLFKAGANIDNIQIMHKFRALTKERMPLLAMKMESWRPDLVVIDTLSAYMGGERDMHRQNEVGEFLAQLTEMAEAIGCAVLGIGHLNKQSVEHPLYRIVGSIGFAASIRSALFLGADPDAPDDRDRLALAHGKANASEIGKTMLFQRIGGGREDVPTLAALELSDATATDVCRAPKNDVGRPSSESQRASEFILDFLDDQKPVEWSALQRSALLRGIASVGTLNLVRAQLAKEGKIRQIGKGPKAKWTASK